MRILDGWYRFAYSPIAANLLLPPSSFLFSAAFRLTRRRRGAWGAPLSMPRTLPSPLSCRLCALPSASPGSGLHNRRRSPWLRSSDSAYFRFDRFEQTPFTRHERRDCAGTSVRSSSCLAPPPILRRPTGDIGYHHVHIPTCGFRTVGCAPATRPRTAFGRRRCLHCGPRSSNGVSCCAIQNSVAWSNCSNDRRAPGARERFPCTGNLRHRLPIRSGGGLSVNRNELPGKYAVVDQSAAFVLRANPGQ